MRQRFTGQAALGVLGAPAMADATDHRLGLAVVVLEMAVAGTLILTALFAPDTISDRAFRLLPYASAATPPHTRSRGRRQGPTPAPPRDLSADQAALPTRDGPA